MGSSWGGNDNKKSQNVYKNEGRGEHRDPDGQEPCVVYGLAALSITIGTLWGAVQGFPT